MKILIVRLSAFGDIIHALPIAENARAHGASVAWLVEPRYAEVLEGNPNVEKLFFADTRSWRRRPLAQATRRAIRELASGLADFRPDAAIDPQGNWKSAIFARFSRAPVVGLSRRHRRERTSVVLCQHPVHPAPAARHIVDQNLALLAPLSIPITRRPPNAGYLLLRQNGPAERFLASQPKPFAVFHPGSARARKVWGEAPLAGVAARLWRERGLSPVISWGPGDEPRADRMQELLPGAVTIPPLPVSGLAHVLAASSLVVAADTGPLHLADALGVPTLGLFGPTDPDRTGPYRGTAVRFTPATTEEDVVSRASAALESRARRPA